MALIDDFKARFIEFDTNVVDTYLPILEPLWACYYCGDYDTPCGQEIVLNLLAHMLVGETSQGTGSVKDATSKTVGSVSVSYAQGAVINSERNGWLRGSKYGLRYMLLTRSRQGGFFV